MLGVDVEGKRRTRTEAATTMTRRYPPLRLDQGGYDPEGLAEPVPASDAGP